MPSLIARRVRGEFVVDEWGADPELVDLIDPIVGAVLRVRVEGEGWLPDTGPAVLVANRRFGVVEPFAVVRGVRQATGRRTRFLGVPDVAPIGPVLRRFGGAAAKPAELAGLLRAGHLCTVALGASLRRPLRAGPVPPEVIAPAMELGAPVIPVAVIGGELSGRWRVIVGEPVAFPVGTTPLALAELADAARTGVQALLDEAFPPRGLFS